MLSCLVELEKEGKVVISSLPQTVWADLTVNVGQTWSERHGKEQVMRVTCTKNMRQAQPSDTNSVVTFSARFMHSPTINFEGGLPGRSR